MLSWSLHSICIFDKKAVACEILLATHKLTVKVEAALWNTFAIMKKKNTFCKKIVFMTLQ